MTTPQFGNSAFGAPTPTSTPFGIQTDAGWGQPSGAEWGRPAVGDWGQGAPPGHYATPAVSTLPTAPTGPGGPVGMMGPGTPPAVFYKKRWVAALFSFFWSSIGAANWYLGNYYRALAQMIVGGTGILVAQLGPLVVISGKGFEATAGMHVPLIFGLFLWSVVLIWGFVEFIMILGGFGPYRRDARGYDLV